MKALVFSDLHIGRYSGSVPEIRLPEEAVDVVLVAGDISAPVAASKEWLQDRFGGKKVPVLLVAGNHEHYGQTYERSLANAALAVTPDVTFLENTETVIDGVRFLGTTLWTDFAFYGTPEKSMKDARLAMNDYFQIASTDPLARHGRFSPELSVRVHGEAIEWLEERFADPFPGKTVLLVHHCVHPMSVDAQYAGDKVNPAFTSDLHERLVRWKPALVVHGHTHSSFDYVIPGTDVRVVCNPRGYVQQRHSHEQVENQRFDPQLIVEF